MADYAQLLQPGKYITYRVDSLVFPDFGRSIEIHKYQQKHVIDAQFTDNLGRPSFRVFRYISDSTGTQPWKSNGSYFITLLDDQMEIIEDNLRFIKLHVPFNIGFSWKGNAHLPQDPYYTLFGPFGNDDDMDDWQFTYDSFEPSFNFQNQDYTNVWTVDAVDELDNVPIADPNFYAFRNRSLEKYSKGIGLVYRELVMWDYQPNPTGTGGPYYSGFGITQWMVDHN